MLSSIILMDAVNYVFDDYLSPRGGPMRTQREEVSSFRARDVDEVRAREGASEKGRLSEAGRIRSTALMDMLTDKLAHY